MAFVSLSGIVVLGLGSALEQESTLLGFQLNKSEAPSWTFVIQRVLPATILVWLLFWLPIFSWQERLFGDVAMQVQISVTLGTPGLFLANVARGFITARGDFNKLGKAHVIFGLSNVVIPLLLYSLNLPLIEALIFGQSIAWVTPLCVLLRQDKDAPNTMFQEAPNIPYIANWLMVSNFLLLANLNSTNLILRANSESISSSLVAESQLLVTVSCISSSLVLGLFSFLIGQSKRGLNLKRRGLDKYFSFYLSLFSAIFVFSVSSFRDLIVRVLLPRDSQISFLDSLLLTTPAFFWTVSLILSAKLIAQEKLKKNLISWLLGMTALTIVPTWMNTPTFRSLVIWIFLASLASPLAFALTTLSLSSSKTVMDSSYNKAKSRGALFLNTMTAMPRSLKISQSQRKTRDDSVNIVVPFNEGTGIGRFGQIIEAMIIDSGRKVNKLQFGTENPIVRSSSSISRTTVAVLSPGHLPFAEFLLPRSFVNCDYRSALIFWDVDKMPNRFNLGFRLLDELWAPSTYVANTLKNHTDLPVQTISIPISPLTGGSMGLIRNRLNIKDDFLFAYQFDFGSSVQRKNPWAAVKSYVSAFPVDNSGAHLLLKSSRADTTSPEWKLLENLCAGRKDISLINEFWDDNTVASLYLDIDCYLSTHRSEGYGLTLAHALAAGKYVIATNFGGVTDFLPSNYCGLIPFDLVPVGENRIYPSNAYWAEPNVEEAGFQIRSAFENAGETRRRGMVAGEIVRTQFSLEGTAHQVNSIFSATF